MKFIKDNAFILGTLLLVLVVGTISFIFARSNNAKSQSCIKQYVRLSDRLIRIYRSGINPQKVSLAKKRVEQMRKLAQQTAQAFLEKNRNDYEVVVLDISGKKIPIFPVDPKFKDRETLRLLFPSEYRRQVRMLLQSLKPTTPPTAHEILEEAAKIAASLAPEKTTQPSGTLAPAGLGSRVFPRTRGEERRYERYSRRRELGNERALREELERRRVLPRELGRRGSTILPVPGRSLEGKSRPLSRQTLPPVAQDLAIQKLKAEKAQKGWIYADELSMFEADLSDAKRYDDAELFMKQVSLWVQKDIVDAINRTNEQAHREVARIAAGSEQGVAASAVKRLISINVRGFVVAGTSSQTSRREGYRFGAEGGERFGTPVVSQGSAAEVSLEYLCPGGEVIGSVPKLTGRSCNTLYDVVHYDFTVIMPVKYLPVLYQNLMMENFHTILDVRIENPYLVSNTGAGRTPRAGTVQDQQLYYYGNESVMQVSIVGEMILLTDWTRGRWDDEKKQWDTNFPPLMPVDLLKQIDQINPAALREEDKARLEAASPKESIPTLFGGSGWGTERRR